MKQYLFYGVRNLRYQQNIINSYNQELGPDCLLVQRENFDYIPLDIKVVEVESDLIKIKEKKENIEKTENFVKWLKPRDILFSYRTINDKNYISISHNDYIDLNPYVNDLDYYDILMEQPNESDFLYFYDYLEKFVFSEQDENDRWGSRFSIKSVFEQLIDIQIHHQH